MKRIVDWRVFVPTVTVAALIAWAINSWMGVPFWVSLLMVVGAIVANGILALVEDEMPGGFNNPRKRSPSDDAR
jgi:hypothetical protein